MSANGFEFLHRVPSSICVTLFLTQGIVKQRTTNNQSYRAFGIVCKIVCKSCANSEGSPHLQEGGLCCFFFFPEFQITVNLLFSKMFEPREKKVKLAGTGRGCADLGLVSQFAEVSPRRVSCNKRHTNKRAQLITLAFSEVFGR